MHRKSLHALSLIVASFSPVLLSFGAPYRALATTLSESEVRAFQSCHTDEECVAATNGCCDCANGGTDIAIRKDSQGAFEAQKNCGEVMCTAMARLVPCRSGKVSCRDSVCQYTEPEQGRPTRLP